jgi:2Fe-2S ferredoxin
MEAAIGATLLENALRAGVDWGFNCSRGTCARCRCLVQEGADVLAEPTDAEWDRLGPEELDAGFRLGCQAVVARNGDVTAVNRTYF